MTFTDQEDDLVARIIAKINPMNDPKITVVPMPENEKQFKKPFEGVRVTVGYIESKFGSKTDSEEFKTVHLITQDERVYFDIYIESRLRRGDYGLLPTLDKLRRALIGYKPVGCYKLFAISQDEMIFDEDLWRFSFKIAAYTMLVEQPDQVNEPLLQQVSYDTNFGNMNVPQT